MRIRLFGVLALVAAALWSGGPAAAQQTREIRIARQLGLGYLQLYVAQELGLVEKHAKALGLGDVRAVYQPVGNPSSINDALLSGSADFGAAGVPPFILLWDRTRTNLRVRAVAALNAQPAFLNTVKPEIKSLEDFGPNDRIALPAVRTALQAILLQMAAEKRWGPGQHARLDNLTVSLAHPEATAALLSGRTEITAHFTSPPFQYQQLQDPRVRKVLSSYDITDGPASFSAIWTTTPFVERNPLAARAVFLAVEEATRFIAENRAEAARIFLKLDNSRQPPEFVEGLLADPEITFSVVPQNVEKFADFMARTGTIAVRPASWRDLFFPFVHDRPGS